MVLALILKATRVTAAPVVAEPDAEVVVVVACRWRRPATPMEPEAAVLEPPVLEEVEALPSTVMLAEPLVLELALVELLALTLALALALALVLELVKEALKLVPARVQQGRGRFSE